MIQNKADVYDILRASYGQDRAITHKEMMDIMGYILDRENELQNDIAKWMENCNKLMRMLKENE